MALNSAQFEYLRDVLGIEGVIIPSVDFGEASLVPMSESRVAFRTTGQMAKARLLILAASSNAVFPCEGEAADMAAKMIKAMKLQESEVIWLEWTHAENEACPHEVLSMVDTAGDRPVLVFGEQTLSSALGVSAALGEWLEWNGVRILTTHSLVRLLQDSSLKREAWVHLQTVMKVL